MATKKATAKKTGAKKAVAGKSVAGKSESKASPKEVAGKTAAGKSTAKRAPGKTAGSKHTAAKDDNYTKPELREKIKDQVTAGDKGGRPGQWSARKAQMVAHEYEAEGGGYKHERNETQKSLKSWGDEHWHTADGKPAIRDSKDGGEETHRYLPDEAWKQLSPEEKKATNKKKVAGSRKGKQFVANTPEAGEARKHAEKK